MKKNKLKNILIFIVIIILCIYGFKKITNMGSKFTSKDNLKVDCEHEWDNLNDKDKKIIKQVISLAKKKLGTEYVWGGKGEIITEERYNELSKEDIDDMFRKREQLFTAKNKYNAKNYAQMHYNFKVKAPFSKEMQRSVEEALKEWDKKE